jgi:hypothetical protein
MTVFEPVPLNHGPPHAGERSTHNKDTAVDFELTVNGNHVFITVFTRRVIS